MKKLVFAVLLVVALVSVAHAYQEKTRFNYDNFEAILSQNNVYDTVLKRFVSRENFTKCELKRNAFIKENRVYFVIGQDLYQSKFVAISLTIEIVAE